MEEKYLSLLPSFLGRLDTQKIFDANKNEKLTFAPSLRPKKIETNKEKTTSNSERKMRESKTIILFVNQKVQIYLRHENIIKKFPSGSAEPPLFPTPKAI